jgi:hypothetical protein
MELEMLDHECVLEIHVGRDANTPDLLTISEDSRLG